MRDLVRWEWFAVAVAIIAALFYLLHWLSRRLPPHVPPNNRPVSTLSSSAREIAVQLGAAPDEIRDDQAYKRGPRR